MNKLMNNEYKCTSKGNKESVEIIYTDNKNKVLRNDGVRKGEILYEETSRKEVYLMNELHNMKNNLFDNTPFSNYIHFYEIYNNLKYITLYNTYIKEKNKEIYRNTEILIEGCKRVLHAMGDGSDQLFDNKRNDSLGSSSNIESIGGTHNFANNGGTHNFANNGGTHNFANNGGTHNFANNGDTHNYANTSNSYNFDHSTNPYNFPSAANFDNIVLLYADSIFNKFTNIFMYINKECYKRGNVSRNSIRYEDDFIEVEVARQAERAPSDLGDDLMSSNTDRSSNAYIQGNNKKASFLCRQKYTDGMHAINKDLVKKLNYAQGRENEKCSYNNGSRRSIYNIFGNSIYSDIDDINIYMKYKENYIHSLMMDKLLLKKKRPQNSRNKLKDNQEEAYTHENNLQKRMTHTQGLKDQSWFEQRDNKMNQTDQAAQTNQAVNLADSNPFTTNTSTHCQRSTRDMHSQKGHTK
ncbi:hypothetical protein, conserved [Plasmodium malariae]|uniref:Uncharacterized protein n=1 Tax=Plasmodium malariae TaxID=5858 RepID=A0A1A8WZ46_PLAMA|nr:hypothetical protein, conserved [Plasmodium malariae]